MYFMYFLIALPLRCVYSQVFDWIISPPEDPSYYYNMVELVCKEGYYVQEHTTVTTDDYIITLFRIPGGKRRQKVEAGKNHYNYVHRKHHPDFDDCFRESQNVTYNGPVVLLAHGMSAASDCWVLQGSKYDLAYILADAGYDVWFSNIRGNFYSKGHKPPRLPDKLFWDFSFHENGLYDIAATIDYILNYTGVPNLQYVGHSMGTTMFFVLAAAKPEYNQKIRLFIGLTPVAHIRRKSFNSQEEAVLNAIYLLSRAYYNSGIYYFFPRNDLSNWAVKTFCGTSAPAWVQNLCYDICFFFTGYPSKLLKREKLPVFLSHGFSGCSVKTFYHFIQLLDSPAFLYYDYGPAENTRRYGQAEPPEYDLRKVTTPVALFYSKGDYIAVTKDVENLRALLPNVVESHDCNPFNHIDFIWAYTAKDMIYPRVLELLNEFKNQ